MRDEYDIDSLNPRPNPYADELNKEFDFSNAVKNPYAKMHFEGINNISDDFMADTDSRTVPKAIDEMSKTEFNEMMAQGLAQAKADEGKPASDVLKDVRATIEDALDEADAYSEKHHKRLTHEQIFNSETKVTFRQVVEKTIAVDGQNMSDIQAQIEKLKKNPDEIDFDKEL
ncbi:hypothetical protein bpr_II188 (plasmid) [Butyrivibrio proteoclasticus B316]|uniref:Uncharacterized protein n=1 Tax=Butyrivibrio proteoclasticus (strain ATCC 51982 / DSM 14932 / B316) TaxID=515622 RepID=E0S3Z4_BUTPB|nr:hypothetical protein [Butyrivibrio proteoclasticus]ADL36126.1 hypothetical protein bpr_II188 [Butyrivibrio proteoclasticus B316]